MCCARGQNVQRSEVESEDGRVSRESGEKHRDLQRNRAGQLDDYTDPIRGKSLAEGVRMRQDVERRRQGSKRATYG